MDEKAELARLREDMELFARAASHDLTEPLRMVSSYLTLLERRYRGKLDRDADDFIEFAVDGARRMQRIIAGLVAFARVDTRGGAVDRTDADAVLDEVLSGLHPALELTGAGVERAPLPPLMADREQLARVFRIALENALEYRGERPPRIAISATRDGEWVCVAIADRGCGFDMAHAERIFGLCTRLHTIAEHPGSGIGLAIARRIIARHGGRIWAESVPGEGTTIRFTLRSAD